MIFKNLVFSQIFDFSEFWNFFLSRIDPDLQTV